MSRASTPEKENQSNTTAIKAKDIVKGKTPLVNLPEPYLFVYSDDGIQNGDLVNALLNNIYFIIVLRPFSVIHKVPVSGSTVNPKLFLMP